MAEKTAAKLYVGGLPYSTRDEELRELFEGFGEVVSATVIMDKFSGKSKGFGFVEMSTEDEAKAAIEGLHEKEFGGRNILVSVAREKSEDGGRSGGFRRGGNNNGGRRHDGGSFRYR